MVTQTLSSRQSVTQHLNSDPSSGKVIKAFVIATFIAFCFLLGAIVMSSIAQKQQLESIANSINGYHQQVQISQNALEALERSLQNKFASGEPKQWRFVGLEVREAGVDAYIQIPTPLALTGSEFDAYVRHFVCPEKSDILWHKVRAQQVTIRLYTDIKGFASQTRCA